MYEPYMQYVVIDFPYIQHRKKEMRVVCYVQENYITAGVIKIQTQKKENWYITQHLANQSIVCNKIIHRIHTFVHTGYCCR